MNIVITGGTSFIGVPLICRLLEQGHQVFAVVRPGSKNRSRLPVHPNLKVISMELCQLDRIAEEIMVSCQIFFHFGWDGAGSDNRTNRAVQQKNVSDSMKAIEGAAALGCRRFLFSGSQAEYGMYQEKMTEAALCNPVSEYGKAKVAFGTLARKACEENGMEYIHARIFSIYGPGDHPYSLVESCIRVFREEASISLGECTQLWNFLYIDDLIQALLFLAFSKKNLEQYGYTFNIAGGSEETRPLREYVEMIYEACGEKGTFAYGTRAPNAEGPANLIPDITKIREAVGWNPEISFQKGILKRLKEFENDYKSN